MDKGLGLTLKLPERKKYFKIFNLKMRNKFISKNLQTFLKTLPILSAHVYSNSSVSLTVSEKRLLSSIFILKNHANFQFKILSCISGVDYPNKKRRFKIVYELLSVRYNTRLTLKVFSDEITPVSSLTSIFPAAGWYESEIWDMFGVFFINHSNLTRLLTDYGFEGYPLRKDFPLSGFTEVSYDFIKKQVLKNKIELSQELKTFKFSSPWEEIKL